VVQFCVEPPPAPVSDSRCSGTTLSSSIERFSHRRRSGEVIHSRTTPDRDARESVTGPQSVHFKLRCGQKPADIWPSSRFLRPMHLRTTHSTLHGIKQSPCREGGAQPHFSWRNSTIRRISEGWIEQRPATAQASRVIQRFAYGIRRLGTQLCIASKRRCWSQNNL